MRLAVIINPVSGAGLDTPRLQTFFRNARAAGAQLRSCVTRYPGHACQVMRDITSHADAVIAVGGDGTVREVAESLAGTEIPLLIWPQGTENLVAKSLGFRADPDLILRTLQTGSIRCVDLGQANHQTFMVVAGVGFDAEVVERLTRYRDGHITHMSYLGPLWRTFWEHRWPSLTVTAQTPEGPVTWTDRGMVFVGNMARYALGLPVVPSAVPDDGLLDLVAMRCRGHLHLLAHSLRTLRRKHIQHPGVLARRVTSLYVESNQPVPVEIDGEYAGRLPLKITIRPGALRVKVPPPGPDR